MATMKDIANLLGVELYEEFEIKETCGKYRITEKTIEANYYGDWKESSLLLENFFNGTYELEPWKPQYDDTYYYVDTVAIKSTAWRCDITDIALYNMGNCFKTIEEAEKHKEEILGNLKRIR